MVIMGTEQPTSCFVPLLKLSGPVKINKPHPKYFNTDRSNVVVLLWFSVVYFWCQTFGDVSPSVCLYCFQFGEVTE